MLLIISLLLVRGESDGEVLILLSLGERGGLKERGVDFVFDFKGVSGDCLDTTSTVMCLVIEEEEEEERDDNRGDNVTSFLGDTNSMIEKS